MGKKLIRYYPAFAKALKRQLESDEIRWGNTWKKRPIKGQEERVFKRYADYYSDMIRHGSPIPWLKVAGEAMICWVRENFSDWSEE